MAKFSRFDPSNKKRAKDKYQSRDRDYRFEKEEREARNHHNRQQLVAQAQAYFVNSKESEDSMT
jgi:hypothetical protein